jgi:hypothetical protein
MVGFERCRPHSACPGIRYQVSRFSWIDKLGENTGGKFFEPESRGNRRLSAAIRPKMPCRLRN